MALKPRTVLRIVVVAVGLGLLAWKQFHPHAPAMPGNDAVAAAKPQAAARPRTWKLGRLTLTACELGRPDSGLTTAAWCAPFEVPENRADPHGRKITLNLAVIRSEAQVPAGDMLVFLAGGPGQAATESWSTVAPALDGLLAHRDVLLIDQRGTGKSHPLECKAVEKATQATQGLPFDAQRLREQTTQCLKEIEAKADPRFYTTTAAVADLEDARQALGVASFDLVGVSYGTRMAQQYAMHHPHAVRSLVLDGVVPNSLVLGEDFARNLEDALKAQFARCTAEPACKTHFGDPYQTLYQLRDALRANPHKVSFRDPQTYQSVERTLSDDALASVVRLFAYSPVTAALLPLSIDAAAHGDVGPLLGQAKLITGDLADSMNSGMQFSVFCSEDADLLKARPQDADTILGTRMVDTLQAVCSVWPRGDRPADFHQPLQASIPTLLLSGQYDPVTPPRYGEEVLSHLSNARHLVLKGQGHNVIGAGCAPTLVKHFIEDIDPRKLDAGCLDRLQPTPLFIDFNGATP
ncbi:MAG TPA: alpha/beta fold hydrolase [Frateuria sp.]|uniref:alpha/beta fold hydrolase n=1 Tax=Frateuria sp. TaxID=2211372 RepID=UPI002D80012A|nr:alpha/beta fold hydrolase [Frateuria sp.]HET6805697.1 alpha/beta fold hydrolase [Frateuria sp.]